MRWPTATAAPIRTLAAAYGSGVRAPRLAEHDAAAKRLNVTLTGRDAVGAFTLEARLSPRCGAIPATPASLRPSSRSASSKAAGRPSSRAAAAGGGAKAVRRRDLLIAVEFRGMSEWQDISRKLAATPGIEELDVAGLSARGAR